MIEPPEHEGELQLSYISKYLIQCAPVKKVQKASKRATGARVLTSDGCAKSIFEQDEKKSLPTSRIVLLGNTKEPILLIQVM